MKFIPPGTREHRKPRVRPRRFSGWWKVYCPTGCCTGAGTMWVTNLNLTGNRRPIQSLQVRGTRPSVSSKMMTTHRHRARRASRRHGCHDRHGVAGVIARGVQLERDRGRGWRRRAVDSDVPPNRRNARERTGLGDCGRIEHEEQIGPRRQEIRILWQADG